MLRQAKTLKGYKVESLDGDIGKVRGFYFDDQRWVIRYLVVETGNWLMARRVLISPHAVIAVLPRTQHVAVALTKTQIEHSPSVDRGRPTFFHFGWGLAICRDRAPCRDGPAKGMDSSPASAIHDTGSGGRCHIPTLAPHGRNTTQVRGYHLQAANGAIGCVQDLIIDNETWAIRYLVVKTRNRGPGQKVLVASQWIERVSWTESKVFVRPSCAWGRQAGAEIPGRVSADVRA